MAAKVAIKSGLSETKAETKVVASAGSSYLAVVLVRGLAKVTAPIIHTLHMLRLTRKNRCVLIPNTSSLQGMLHKAKDYITWGELSAETLPILLTQRGEEYQAREKDRKGLYSYKFLERQGKKYKPYFSLNPPRKGFGRKGIKVSFKAGGALGYRGTKINDLIQRML